MMLAPCFRPPSFDISTPPQKASAATKNVRLFSGRQIHFDRAHAHIRAADVEKTVRAIERMTDAPSMKSQKTPGRVAMNAESSFVTGLSTLPKEANHLS
ncbi:hypothetical protein [Parvibaculum sp.]|uniref:hypothetical protein n=1 Tax=Parvibaculum sp. TaxID=2024848 RepID=UPI001E05A700|nr:hypothetical protein [Parvibaculum sp.]MBX3488490.1 hypothetical protein [Parvibaculum sp.]